MTLHWTKNTYCSQNALMNVRPDCCEEKNILRNAVVSFWYWRKWNWRWWKRIGHATIWCKLRGKVTSWNDRRDRGAQTCFKEKENNRWPQYMSKDAQDVHSYFDYFRAWKVKFISFCVLDDIIMNYRLWKHHFFLFKKGNRTVALSWLLKCCGKLKQKVWIQCKIEIWLLWVKILLIYSYNLSNGFNIHLNKNLETIGRDFTSYMRIISGKHTVQK